MGSSKQTCVQASQAETDKSTALPQTIFLLVYDATDLEHNGDKSDIRLPDQTFSTLINEQPQGVLGFFRSKTQAMIEGKIWLYTQLFNRTGDDVDLPLPHEKDNEFNSELIPVLPGTWRRSGWTAFDSYWIMDKGRSCENREEVALMVAVEERVLDQVDDGVEYVTDEEPTGEEDVEGDGHSEGGEDAGEDEQYDDDDETDSEDESEDYDEAEEHEEGRIAAGIVGTQAPAA